LIRSWIRGSVSIHTAGGVIGGPLLAAQHFNWQVSSIPPNRAVFRLA
jgi:hypothetical protein